MATKIRTLKFAYTSQISFVGQVSKIQFIQDVADLTCENKNAIRERIIETNNPKEIEIASLKVGCTVKITS